ncbi:UNVERIFIED_CONTAM: Stromal cell-derived factor 2, partial [Eudyptes robustus]
RLHSHEVKYGSGSQQQSVTGTNSLDDINSHWQILGANNAVCKRGEPIKCGDTIRLVHLTTKCFLHSHEFPSPLSKGNQEISCFGKSDEQSDTGDHWKVVCNSDVWTDEEQIQLKHVDTGKYLATSGQTYGRPISGQKEVVGFATGSGYNTYWQAAEGVYIQKKDEE